MAFWKPGTIAPGSNIERDTGEETLISTYNPNELKSIFDQRKLLPVYKSRNQLLYLIEKYQVVIVAGETGSGKTTQIPQYLAEAGWAEKGYVIACTQPRRIAATTIAARVAEEANVPLGGVVGYAVRFDDRSDPHLTRIKYMTDGMLFRETLRDPLLTRYSVIMVDEAHERSMYTDILIGLLKKILKKRPDLRVVISSATLDANEFLRFFQDGNEDRDDVAVIVSLDGRMFPVDINYLPHPCENFLKTAVDTVLHIHKHEAEGDILVFLTGRGEIEEALELLQEYAKDLPRSRQILPLPLHSGLTSEEQLQIFKPAPAGHRKVVLSTNIAEASVTIDGIVYVVDCGFVKIRAYNPQTNMESLIVVPTSKASSLQRAGRAGRVRPGKVYRLYTEEAYKGLPDHGVPEMQRSNLTTVILQLKAIGIENVLRFDFLSPPPSQHMIRALEILYSLKTLDDYGRMSIPLGYNVAEFPLDPMLSTFLLNSEKYGCTEEALIIAAMISVQNVFVSPSGQRKEAGDARRQFAVEEGDHLTYVNVYRAFVRNNQSPKWCYNHFLNHKALAKAVSIRAQLQKHLKRFNVKTINSCGEDMEPLLKCLVSGFFSQAAKMRPDGTYATLRDRQVLSIHPHSVLFKRSPAWILFHEVVETTKPFMREITVIQPEWLPEIAPHYYEFLKKK